MAELSESGSEMAAADIGAFAVRPDADPPDGGHHPAMRGAPRRADSHRVTLLAQAIENDIIPRLLLSRHATGEAPRGGQDDAPRPTAADIERLAAVVITGDLPAASAFVAVLRARNLPLPLIYLEVLAPAARRLGEMWQEDRCDFASVTIGLCCLQQLVLENCHAFEPRPGRPGAERRILLAPVPGEQHGFGMLIVGEFFRRQGWDVTSGTGAAGRELVAMARRQWFGIVGFSLACDSRLDALAALIHDLRRSARNPDLGIIVGGRVFTDRPELAVLVGADATAADGQQAVLKAETLLALTTRCA